MITRFCVASAISILALLPASTALAGSASAGGINSSGTIDKLYRLDCGHSKANDESVWTPDENVGKTIEFASTRYLIRHGSDALIWDTGVPENTINDPTGVVYATETHRLSSR